MVSAISRYLTDFQLDGSFDKRFPNQGSPQETPPEVVIEDTASLIREAEDRVRTEERSRLQDKVEAAIAAERARTDELLTAYREKWAREETDRLAVEISDALQSMEAKLVAQVARLLTPFLTEAVHAQVIDELKTTLVSILSDNQSRSMTIRGPQDLLSNLAAKLRPVAASIEFIADQGSEIRVIANDTILETQLSVWTQRLAEAVQQS
ncbi:hypothetical protein [Microvirga alba]|uniref:Uncharacterized protein n=1 Tax=Microvirga alba TaxID=2791025 RepID=A0A931FNR4_9HYPH|nr:hypothetical protein [Microvirga alba]MBF9232612.1 hypothetical protein [Microvirga alba]